MKYFPAVFIFALMKLDYTRVDHERILQTIYRHLTGDSLACPTYGGHWEVVGFQGKKHLREELHFLISVIMWCEKVDHEIHIYNDV